jgi:two-component system response regulator YesN
MAQLLIVDDEAHAVDSLAETIPWGQYGIESVYRAYSGTEALEILKVYPVDIVVTDICMPDITGIDLIQEIYRSWRKIKCIILSGHADFEFAKQALIYQSVDYLIKPVKDQVLVDAVLNAKQLLEKEWSEVASYQHAVDALKENLPLLRANLLNELLQGYEYTQEALDKRMKMFELPFRAEEEVALILIRLETDSGKKDVNNVSMLEFSLSNMTHEVLKEDFELWSCKDAHGYLILIVKLRQGHELLKADAPPAKRKNILEKLCIQLQQSVKSYLGENISVLLSDWGNLQNGVSALYQSSLYILRKHFGNASGLLMSVTDYAEEKPAVFLSSLYEPPMLINLLESRRWDDAEEKLEKAFNQLKKDCSGMQEHILEAYFVIAGSFTYIAHKNGQQLEDIIADDFRKVLEPGRFQSVNQLYDWSMHVLDQIRNDMDKNTKSSHLSVVKQVNSFAESHLTKDVTLQAIASHINLHPIYLSKIYKVETGENISDYLHRFRMDKAAFLLKNTQKKIYDITAELGYQNPNYFARIFKKHFGASPQEYRDG